MNRLFFLVLSMACSGESLIDKQPNEAPSITIMSHQDGDVLLEGYTVQLRAQVSDVDNEFSVLQVAWFSGDDLLCDWALADAAGGSLCSIALSPEDSLIVAEVRDPEGGGGRDEIQVTVEPTQAPVVVITDPQQGGRYYSDQLIPFAATVADAEDPAEDLDLSWSSSLSGALSVDIQMSTNGETIGYQYLEAGEHAIFFRAVDASGKESTDSVVVQVGGPNSLPSCQIVDPQTLSSSAFGSTVIFLAEVSDADIPEHELQVEWESDKDGLLGHVSPTSTGEVTLVYEHLSIDTHTITMTVRDEVGGVCSDAIVLTIGIPPVVQIGNPSSGTVFSLGQSISFEGTVQDDQSPPHVLDVVWSSDLDGVLSTQSADSQGSLQFSAAGLSAGLHNISLAATDTEGFFAQEVTSIRVNTPPEPPLLQFVPAVVGTSDDIAISASSIDADGDALSYSYSWTKNGAITTYATDVVPASATTVGDIWAVTVEASDGYVTGAASVGSIVVVNVPPSLSNLQITSSNGPYNDSTFTCTATVTDPDEVLIPTVQWNWNGQVFNTSTLNISSLAVLPLDVLTCTASVTDSQGASDTASVSEIILNRPPVVSATIDSSVAYVTSVLTCIETSSDPDGEVPTLSYLWFNGTTIIGSQSTVTLNTGNATVGDSITCEVSVTDASGAASTATASVVVSNAPPTIDVLSLTPTTPVLTDILMCTASASDPEADPTMLSFVFLDPLTALVHPTTSSAVGQASLDLSTVAVSAGDSVMCMVTAVDSNGASVTDSITVVVNDSAPTFTSAASISPSVNTVLHTTLTCVASATDLIDGVITPTYSWRVNGGVVGHGSIYTIDPVDASVGDVVECTATATDSDGEVATSSASVQVDNSVPQVSNVLISSSDVGIYNDSTLTCTGSVFDADEVLSLTYAWTISGVAVGSSNTLDLSTTAVVVGDSIGCEATAVDSQGASASAVYSVQVDNRLPSSPGISLTQSPAATQDDIVCEVTTPSVDPDGHVVVYQFDWTVNGNATTASGTTATTSTIFAALIQGGELWQCTVTPDDGHGLGNSVSSSTTVVGYFSDVAFDHCGQTGQSGPSQSQCDASYAGTSLANAVTVTAGSQMWVVPEDGEYLLEVAGAMGGSSSGTAYTGGYGAYMSGEFSLVTGDVVEVWIGQMGEDSTAVGASRCASGGGGGTFVTLNGSLILAAGGGGGSGAAGNGGYNGNPGTTYENAGAAAGWLTLPTSSVNGSGGTSGSGGTGGNWYAGAGGAGWLSDGGDSIATGSGALGGNRANPNRGSDIGNGGDGAVNVCQGGAGGFGGGGGSMNGGGGGGGYSGGAGGVQDGTQSATGGGGGGSINTGSAPLNFTNSNPAHGYLRISEAN